MDEPPGRGRRNDPIDPDEPLYDPPHAAVPSVWLFRGSLFALGVATALAIFLVVSPPSSEGKAEPTRTFATPTRPASPTATATPPGATPSVTVLVPTQSPSPSATATTNAAGRTYTIVAGDTLSSIAVQFNVTVEAIVAANPGIAPNDIQLGATINIPGAQ